MQKSSVTALTACHKKTEVMVGHAKNPALGWHVLSGEGHGAVGNLPPGPLFSADSIVLAMAMIHDNFQYKLGPPDSGFSLFLAERTVPSLQAL